VIRTNPDVRRKKNYLQDLGGMTKSQKQNREIGRFWLIVIATSGTGEKEIKSP